MANHSYPVEMQSDFLEKITRAKPDQTDFLYHFLS